MKKYEEYPIGSPKYVYYRGLFEINDKDIVSFSNRIKLNKEWGNYKNKAAFHIASLLMGDTKHKLFGRSQISRRNKHICGNCIHRDVPTITGLEGDCIEPENKAKIFFKFWLKLILPSKMGGKEVGLFCPYFENKNK